MTQPTTPPAAPTTILILDVATSGFSPDKDVILEVAAILVDAGTLDVLDTHSAVVRAPEGTEVPDFHAALLAECLDPERSNSVKAVEGFLLAGQWTLADVLCIQALNNFDMNFLAKHMPTLHRALTKNKPRLELPALARVQAARGEAPYVCNNPKTHRAGDEAINVYEELVHYLAPAGGVA